MRNMSGMGKGIKIAMNGNFLRNLYKDFTLVPREAYQECHLSETDKEILCEIGLPELEFFLEFYTQPDKPVYLTQYHQSYNVAGFADWVVIGEGEYDSLLCIDQQGAVCLLDNYLSGYQNEKEKDISFVNSSLHQLLECLAVYMEYWNQINEEEARITKLYGLNQMDDFFDELDFVHVKITNKIREKFQEIDALALAQEEHWWHFVLEELEQGVI